MSTYWTDPDLQKLVLWPNSVLNKPCARITSFNQELVDLISEMRRVMVKANGIGIAAPQIGVNKQVISICIPKENIDLDVANPSILVRGDIRKTGKTEITREGCLSFPDIFVDVARYREVALVGQNVTGEPISIDLKGLPAICAQHETDHIWGITMVDHLSKLKRDILRKKIEKIMKSA
jgi:peptide deformylase